MPGLSYPQNSYESETTDDGPRPRILVADDDLYLARLLKEHLEDSGYDVSCAADGFHAQQLARKNQFDLILLDVQMPMRNGYQVLEYLRSKPDTVRTPVIIVTGEPSAEVYPHVAKDPRASYIKKPLEIESLNSLLKYYLND